MMPPWKNSVKTSRKVITPRPGRLRLESAYAAQKVTNSVRVVPNTTRCSVFR